MNDILNLSVAKLKRLAALKSQIERLQSQLQALAGNSAPAGRKTAGRPRKRRMSAAARRKIALAAKARWAKVRAAKASKA